MSAGAASLSPQPARCRRGPGECGVDISIQIHWSDIDWGTVVGVLFVLALDAIGINQVWHSRSRGFGEKVWLTFLIIVLPVIGYVGWLINFWIGKLAKRLNRPRDTAS